MRTTALALSLALLSATPSLAAEPAADDATVRAKEAFTAGQQLYKAGRFAEAVARFEAAYAAKPHPSILFNIAKCWEQLDEVAKALRSFKDYLRADPDAKDKQLVADSIGNLERKLRAKGLQQILIFAEPKDATITVNGKMLGTSPASTELPAGTHALAVRASGYTTAERSFTMQLAKGSELSVVLEKPGAATANSAPGRSDAPVNGPALTPSTTAQTAATAPAPKRGRVFTFVAGGLGLAGLGTGIALGVVSANASSTLHAQPHAQAEATQLVNTATTTAIGADIAYGVAGAAAITAVILFIVEGKSATPSTGGGSDASAQR